MRKTREEKKREEKTDIRKFYRAYNGHSNTPVFFPRLPPKVPNIIMKMYTQRILASSIQKTIHNASHALKYS